MNVAVFGFIITSEPYMVHQINEVESPRMRKLMLTLEEGDILSIKGLGRLMIVDFAIEKKTSDGLEVRELYIETIPA